MKKAAHSRYLLPLEMCLGAVSAAIGITGGFGGGGLHAALGVLGYDVTWFLFFFGIGSMRVLIAGGEWRYHRGGDHGTILQFVSVRAALALACLFNWLCSLGWLTLNGLGFQVLFVVLVGVLMLVFNAWSFFENLKVRYALNPRVSTPHLEYREKRI